MNSTDAKLRWWSRFTVWFEALCLLGAGLNHVRDVWQRGWLPYTFAPMPVNVFWTALTFLDVLAAALLLWRPRAGVVLAVTIMLSDVVVNSYGKYGLGFGGGWNDLPLQGQTWFLGFVLGAAPLVWWSAKPEVGAR